MAQYQYIDKGGKSATVDAADSASALKAAGINAQSGVRLVSNAATTPSVGTSTTPVATPTQTQVQAPLSQGQQGTATAVAQERSIAQAQGQSQPTYTSAPSVSATAIGNTQPMALPTTPGNTSSNTAAGAIGAAGGTNQILQELQKQTEDAKLKADKEQSTYDKLMSKYLGKGEATAQAEKDAGVNELKSTAQALTQEYNTKTLSYNAQFQQIMQQPGLSIEQKNNQISGITRNHAYEMTDLSIRQNISQGNYQAAQDGVDKKISIEYGDLKDLISFQSGILSDAKNSLSDKEKTKLTLLNQENERKLAEVTYQAHELQKVKTSMQIEASKNGASQSTIAAIQSAKDEGSAIAAAGKYVGLSERMLLDSQLKTQALQRQNINSEIAKRNAENKPVMVDANGKIFVDKTEGQKMNKEIVTSDAYKAIVKGKDALNYLKEFEKTFKKTGSTSSVFDPVKNSKLKSQYNAATLNLKEFFNLGVLNGPDLSIIQGVLPNPSDTSNFRKFVSVGTYQPGKAAEQGLESMKKMVETTLDDRYNTLSKQYDSYSSNSISSLAEVNDSYVLQKAELNPEIAKLVADNPDLSSTDIISIIKK